jgi:hypothetical protein
MSNLYLPEYISDLLIVSLEPGEFGDAEVQGMMDLNQGANDWIAGRIDNEHYFDMLAQYNLDPIQHLDPALTLLKDFL